MGVLTMYTGFSLRNGFMSKAAAGKIPLAANDDYRPTRDFFTENQISQLNALVIPYLRCGAITGFEYRKGHESSAFIVKDERQGRNNIVFCVAILAPEGQLPLYSANVASAKINAETINFGEVMRTARSAMETMFPERPLATPRFSIV